MVVLKLAICLKHMEPQSKLLQSNIMHCTVIVCKLGRPATINNPV